MSDQDTSTIENETENETETPDFDRDELLAAVEKDGVTVRTQRGKDAQDPVSAAIIRTRSLFDAADEVSSAVGNVSNLTGVLAVLVIDTLRAAIVRADGMPDWAGTTALYRKMQAAVIDRSWNRENESRTTASTRLQKRTVRTLPMRVIDYVIRIESLRISGPDRASLEDVARRFANASSDEGKTAATDAAYALARGNKDVRAVIDAVNKQYRVGHHGPNEPDSPFERKSRVSGGSDGDASDNGDAIAEVQAVESFPTVAASPRVGEGAVLRSVLKTAAVLWNAEVSGDVHYGDAGKETFALDAYAGAVILKMTGKHAQGRNVTAQDQKDLAAALTRIGEPQDESSSKDEKDEKDEDGGDES